MAANDNNITLCWPNRTDQTTLAGGSYLANLPLSNVQNRVFARKARTTDLLLTSTMFTMTLDKARAIGVVAIAAHNFTADATWRIRTYTDDAMTLLNYDSGTISVWPAFYTPEQLEWEDNNFWFGNAILDPAAEYTPLATHFMPINTTCRSIKVEFADESNPAAYVEFGRVFIAEMFKPTINALWDIQFGHENTTEVEVTLNGTEYFDRKRSKRTASMILPALTTQEAFIRMYSMQRDQGIDREVLFAQETQDSEAFYFRTFIGRLTQPDPISQPYLDRHSMSLNLLEIL